MHSNMRIDGCGSIEPLEKSKKRGKCRKWRLWVRADGKKKSRRFSGTYREAQKALEDFKAELEAIVPNEGAFEAYALSWADYRRDSRSYDPNTIAKDYRHVRAISRVMGDMAMQDITPSVCRDALNRLKRGENASGRELTNTTMQGIYTALGSILAQAEDDGVIASNPMRRVKSPRCDTAEREALTREEIELFLNRVDGLPLDGRAMALYLMACLGLRRGEACALLDSDIANGVAFVHRAVKDRDGSIGRPKSAAGIRTLPVPPRLAAKVTEWRRERERKGYGGAETLACNTDGGLLLPQNLHRWWAGDATHKGVRGPMGCDGMTLHQLRHSNLTMMARYLSPFDLQKYAGWSSLEPARIYIHDDLESVTRGVSEAWKVTA